MSTKPHLYISSKGRAVTHHSFSGGDAFHFCARKYYLERIQGWQQREQRSSAEFGKVLERAITYWHQRGQNTDAAVAEFTRLWAEIKGKDLTYNKTDKDWDSLNLTGQELVRLYAIRYADLPYTVDDPESAFQIEYNVEVFPDSKLQGITFKAYLDVVATQKEDGRKLVIDMKTSGKEVPEFTELDPQLRSYSWVTGCPDVAFLWFRKMGRTISRGDLITVLAGDTIPAGAEGYVLAVEDFGILATPYEAIYDEMAARFKGESKAVQAARQQYVETHGKFIAEKNLTKQRLYFKQVTISDASREDIGNTIKRDIVNIVHANETNFYPMESGVRFPNEKCPMCAFRGICADRPELRDRLVERKAVDELELIKIEGTE